MKKYLMCYPDFYRVSYEINPWMHLNINNVNHDLALFQWENLYASFNPEDVALITGYPEVPDMVFTANAGFVFENSIILSKFRNEERQKEVKYFEEYFVNSGYEVIKVDQFYEGEGDHLLDLKGRHWLGTGFRTSKNVIPELESILGTSVQPLKLVDPRWYHLDTCFCPLDEETLLWYPRAFDQASQEVIRNSFSIFIECTDEDALAFACNAVVDDRYVVIPTNRYVSNSLRELGYYVKDVYLSEFLKAGYPDCGFQSQRKQGIEVALYALQEPEIVTARRKSGGLYPLLVGLQSYVVSQHG